MHLPAILSVALAGTSLLGHAAQIHVGSGSRVDFGDARVNFGCADLSVSGSAATHAAQLGGIDNVTIAGALAGDSGHVSLAGSLSGAGAFVPGTSLVTVNDGCGRTASQIGGGLMFHRLNVATLTGKTLQFAPGATTTVTGQLTLQGASGNLLKIRSTVPGTPASLSATALQSVQFVDVADSRAVGEAIAFGLPENYQSRTSGNVYRWFQYDAAGGIDPRALPGAGAGMKGIPSLSTLGTAMLAALLTVAAGVHIRRRGLLNANQ